MTDDRDDRFRPRPGRVGNSAARGRSLSVLAQVNRRIGKAGRSGGSSGASGGRVRGARYATLPNRAASDRRRVVVKARVHRLSGSGAKNARAHLSYIERDGVEKDGSEGRAYDARDNRADTTAFQDRCEGDRHQFRFIVSPEDGAEMESLRPLIRDLMANMERDLDTDLDWVAVDHHDTGHPHTHIVLRGVRDDGGNLVMDRDYIGHGIRQRAEELVRLELGPPTPEEAREKLQRQIGQQRVTTIDRMLVRAADGNLTVEPTSVRLHADGAVRPHHLTQRLRTLQQLGLAAETAQGRWQLHGQLTERLTSLQRRGERHEAIARAFQRRESAHRPGPASYGTFDPSEGRAITGRVAAIGLSGELTGHRYAVIEATDGRTLYAEIGLSNGGPHGDGLRKGDVVTLTPARLTPSKADQTIASVSRLNDGLYSPVRHAQLERGSSEPYLRSHVRRLEAERRLGNAERLPSGTDWRVPDDYLQRIEARLAKRAQSRPVEIETLTAEPLDKLATARGVTWLDRVLAGEAEPGTIAAQCLPRQGFGREVQDALRQRADRLVEQDHAVRGEDGSVQLRRGFLRRLEREELAHVAGNIERETGRRYVPTGDGGSIEGVYARSVELQSGRYALIENERSFHLVPWRDVLERARGREVSGVMRGRSISWSFRRQRDLGLER
ncbi:DUF3363 domain-containing protein [Parvularcula dongshanensis]|uniref:Type IV secretory pathway VirD2 relaxase n=1 Tax=Parvularcula dongshanensis TaxID=1173995 RepID=A0A840I4X2_9PROT|nr:DUF3363 domain-containing protein [Parvularcula dongshanensis]MBB4659331.1 type IV secretory pathway VirD2 relaxase [Parvularcula dongshanensis]